MKKLVALCVLIVISCLPLFGQSQRKETLSIGFVPLSLGMSKATVVSELQKAGYIVGDDNIVRRGSNSGPDSVGALGFTTEGKLNFINRSWTLDNPASPEALATAIYGALKEMDKAGRTTCTIGTDDQVNPMAEIKSMLFSCRPRQSYISVTIARTKRGTSTSVEEILRSAENSAVGP